MEIFKIYFTELCVVRAIKNTLLDHGLGFYWTRKPCPPLQKGEDLLSKSAVELADMIRNRKVTSERLVSGYTSRINSINPILNAIIDGPFEEALIDARQIDKRIANGEITANEFAAKPFLGVPFTTKDSTAIKGKLHTLGIVSRKNAIAEHDAECVRLMKKAGAIILASSSVPEMNMWQETRNNIIGQTNNPYDTRRTVGGSTGGEGALIAACGSAFGLGTDIGGSIRMPCFYCGIVGHKPTGGIVSLKGCSLRKVDDPNTMAAVGPMARYVKDVKAILKV